MCQQPENASQGQKGGLEYFWNLFLFLLVREWVYTVHVGTKPNYDMFYQEENPKSLIPRWRRQFLQILDVMSYLSF